MWFLTSGYQPQQYLSFHQIYVTLVKSYIVIFITTSYNLHSRQKHQKEEDHGQA